MAKKRPTQKERIRKYLVGRKVEGPGEVARALKIPASSVRREFQELGLSKKRALGAGHGRARPAPRNAGPFRDTRGHWRDERGHFTEKKTIHDAAALLEGLLDAATPEWSVIVLGDSIRAEWTGDPGTGDGPKHVDIAAALEEWRRSDLFAAFVGERERVHVKARVLDPKTGIIDGLPASFAVTGAIAVGQAVGAFGAWGARYQFSEVVALTISFFDDFGADDGADE